MEGEIWENIEGLKGLYLISNMGRVRNSKTKVIRAKNTVGKYSTISLRKRTFYIHLLVAKAFIPNPFNYTTAINKNGIKTDNRASNLEWGCRHGTIEKSIIKKKCFTCGKKYNTTSTTKKYCSLICAEDSYSKKKTGKQVQIIQLLQNGEPVKVWKSSMMCAESIGIFPEAISQVLSGKLKSTGGFKFEYYEKYLEESLHN